MRGFKVIIASPLDSMQSVLAVSVVILGYSISLRFFCTLWLFGVVSNASASLRVILNSQFKFLSQSVLTFSWRALHPCAYCSVVILLTGVASGRVSRSTGFGVGWFGGGRSRLAV